MRLEGTAILPVGVEEGGQRPHGAGNPLHGIIEGDRGPAELGFEDLRQLRVNCRDARRLTRFPQAGAELAASEAQDQAGQACGERHATDATVRYGILLRGEGWATADQSQRWQRCVQDRIEGGAQRAIHSPQCSETLAQGVVFGERGLHPKCCAGPSSPSR